MATIRQETRGWREKKREQTVAMVSVTPYTTVTHDVYFFMLGLGTE